MQADTERRRDLLVVQAAVAAQLHHLRQALLDLGQRFQGFVHAHEFRYGVRRQLLAQAGGEGQVQCPAAAALGPALAGQVDQHRAHRARGTGQEMRLAAKASRAAPARRS